MAVQLATKLKDKAYVMLDDVLTPEDIESETPQFEAVFEAEPEVSSKPRITRTKGTNLNAQIHAMNNFTEDERIKLLRAVKLLLAVVNSTKFKEMILQAKFTENTVNGKSYTNQEIYNYIMSGIDQLNPQKDFDIDIDITLYTPKWRRSKVCGYTNPNTRRTWINKYFLANADFAEVADNIIHEYCHKLGFDHHKVWDTSVPYQVGGIVQNLAKEQLDQIFKMQLKMLDSLPQIIFDNNGNVINI